MSDFQQKVRLYGFLWILSTMAVFGGHGFNFEFNFFGLYFNLMLIISLVVVWLLNKLKVVHIAIAIIWTVFFANCTFAIFPYFNMINSFFILAMIVLDFIVVWNCFSAMAKK